jgi:BirA family biotin operon repressor/biotin-[acetyl-CoA-carboxylase] ligase
MEIIHKHFESLTSTNDWVKGHLKTFPKEALLLVSADGQTAARGQYGKRWVSPPGENIYATFGFFLDEREDPLRLTHLLAISTARTLDALGIKCHLKWPNDLLINNKKIAGILCETEDFYPYLGVIIGIGLNVNMPQERLNTIDQPATSIFIENGQAHDCHTLLHTLSKTFASDLSLFLEKGFTPFLPAFQKLTPQ